MIHFFPSRVNTGGLAVEAATGATTLEAGAGTGALNGAGPVRSAEFLCVCMSDVTFFRPMDIYI